jgi:hypothetical protein
MCAWDEARAGPGAQNTRPQSADRFLTLTSPLTRRGLGTRPTELSIWRAHSQGGCQAPGASTPLPTDSSAMVASRLRRPTESSRRHRSSSCRGLSACEVVHTKAMRSVSRSARYQEAGRPSQTSHRDSSGTPAPRTSSHTRQGWESQGPGALWLSSWTSQPCYSSDGLSRGVTARWHDLIVDEDRAKRVATHGSSQTLYPCLPSTRWN